MNYYIVLSVVIAQAVVRSYCKEVTFTRKYCKEQLASGLTYPDHLAVDLTFNDLYFSQKNSINGTRTSWKLNLKTKEVIQISSIISKGANAVNHEGREVFMGGVRGIYKFNPRTNITTFAGAGDKHVWNMFYKDKLYFSTLPEQKLFTFKNDKYELFEDLKDTTALDFIIDNNDTLFYTNITGFYKQHKGATDAVVIMVNNYFSITGLAIDLNGDLFLSKREGILFVNKESLQVEKAVTIYADGGIAFDKLGHLVYADDESIYRLTPKKRQRC